MSSTPYYYCSSLPLEIGSVIRPGNWGRMIRLYTPPQIAQNPLLVVRELVYESVRRQSFPQKPSRFDCIFACLSEADLRDFMKVNNRRFDIGYEVELANAAASSCVADWTTVNHRDSDTLNDIENRASLYWAGHGVTKSELLTLSPLKVVRVLP